MYKTIWCISKDSTTPIKFTQYHFGKTPYFPSWYMEEGHVYEIEIIFNMKLINTFKIFKKCLFKTHEIERWKKWQKRTYEKQKPQNKET